MFTINFWELGPLGWRGSTELDRDFDTVLLALAEAHCLLVEAQRDGVTAYCAIKRSTDQAIVWEGRNSPSSVPVCHN